MTPEKIRQVTHTMLTKDTSTTNEQIYEKLVEEDPKVEETEIITKLMIKKFRAEFFETQKKTRTTQPVKLNQAVEAKVKELRKKVPSGGVHRMELALTPGDQEIKGDKYKKIYHNILTQAGINDSQLREDIIKYRKGVLQHRFSCNATLMSKGKIAASLHVISILHEHGQHVVNYWMKTIDPSSFKAYVNEFKDLMAGYGITSVTITRDCTEKATIDSVHLVFEDNIKR